MRAERDVMTQAIEKFCSRMLKNKPDKELKQAVYSNHSFFICQCLISV